MGGTLVLIFLYYLWVYLVFDWHGIIYHIYKHFTARANFHKFTSEDDGVYTCSKKVIFNTLNFLHIYFRKNSIMKSKRKLVKAYGQCNKAGQTQNLDFFYKVCTIKYAMHKKLYVSTFLTRHNVHWKKFAHLTRKSSEKQVKQKISVNATNKSFRQKNDELLTRKDTKNIEQKSCQKRLTKKLTKKWQKRWQVSWKPRRV